MGMDREYAKQALRTYIAMHERMEVPEEDRRRGDAHTRFVGSLEERKLQRHTVQLIGEVLYEHAPRNPTVEDAKRMLWEIETGDDVRAKLGLDEPGPSLDAHDFHPWVWDAARPHWLSGNHKAALWAAATNVNSRMTKKTGRVNIGETKLVAELFSGEDPQPGKPRLRRCDRSSPSHFNDMHVGASNFGQGLYMAVRNPINHKGEDWDLTEREALESLAAFSLFARWVSSATVETVPEEGSSGV